ncbi:MAG: hypothetical protein U0Z75_07945 [Deinococcaceae bacterium]
MALDLATIVEHPTLWAQYFKGVHREGKSALRGLQTQLHSIPGPIARARECQTLMALDLLDEATRLVENESHPLCRAMWLMSVCSHVTPEAYLKVTEQPESVRADPFTPIGQEAQMRWDFVRAQAFHRLGYKSKALQLFALVRRAAQNLGVDTLFRAAESQIAVLSPAHLTERIGNLIDQIERARAARDQRVFDFMVCSLCFQYAKIEDFVSYLEWAEQISMNRPKIHMVYGAKLLLGQPISEPPPNLDGSEDNGFATMTHILWHFQQMAHHAKRATLADWHARKLLDIHVPMDCNYPTMTFLSKVIQTLTYTWLGEHATANERIHTLYRALNIEEDRETLGIMEGYVDLACLDLARKQGKKPVSNMPEIEQRFDSYVASSNILRYLMSCADPQWFASVRQLN